MDIHNLTEDLVLNAVNDIFDEIEKDAKPDRPCTCYQCRLDAVCYALNRSKPRYVVSNRGYTRAEEDSIDKQQKKADIVTLIYDGIQKIAKSKRPHFEHQSQKERPHTMSGPVFNFPILLGKAYNGQNFEPLVDVEVVLQFEGANAVMIDENFQNPYRIVSNSAGTFSFLPKPLSAEAAGLTQKFGFGIIIHAPGLEETRRYIELTLESDHEAKPSSSRQTTFKIPDIYLFPPEAEDD